MCHSIASRIDPFFFYTKYTIVICITRMSCQSSGIAIRHNICDIHISQVNISFILHCNSIIQYLSCRSSRQACGFYFIYSVSFILINRCRYSIFLWFWYLCRGHWCFINQCSTTVQICLCYFICSCIDPCLIGIKYSIVIVVSYMHC